MIPFMAVQQHLLVLLFFVIPALHQQQSPALESMMRLTDFGTAFQPRNQIELLSTFSNVPSLLQCAIPCNQNRQCRTFDYDQSSLVCRQFEGEFSTGTVLNSLSLASSRIGSLLYNTADALQQYSSYNRTCDQCGIGVNRYLQCINKRCQCPQHTYWNGQICLNQLYDGSSCNDSWVCRQDLNLTCSSQTNTCRQDLNVTFSSQTTTSIVPTVAAWSNAGWMNSSARYSHTASVLPNGTVLVAGGYNGSAGWSSAELYDPSTGIWKSAGRMNSTRYGHTASVLLNGTVLVAGGYNSSAALDSAELYDPSTGIWRSTGLMNSTRRFHTASLLPNGTVLVAGCYNGSILCSAELYDPSTGVWRSTGRMNSTRRYHTASVLSNGSVLVAGGFETRYLDSAEVYDPTTGIWKSTGRMNDTRGFHTVSILPNGTVLVAGGWNGSAALNSAEVYDPSTGVWKSTGWMNSTRYKHTASVLLNGAVLVVAGEDTSSALNSAELYHPA